MTVLYAITREERAAQVAALRAKGLTYREIGGRLGISKSYVRDLIYDPDGSKLAARCRAHRGTCEDCGGPTSNGNNYNVPSVCAPCHLKRIAPAHGTQSRYKAGCSCDECRRANREASRARQGKPPPSHGYSGYVNYGCRCQKCRDGHLVYMRSKGSEHQKAWAKRVRGTEPPAHGTQYAYNTYKCRCVECRRANTEAARAWRAKQKAAA